MTRKIEIPKDGEICPKHAIELASNCDRLSIQVTSLGKDIEKLIPDGSDPMLINLRDKFFSKYLGITSGHLKRTATEIKKFVFGEIDNKDENWRKLSSDSQRLGFFAHFMLNEIEALIPEDSEELQKLKSENFRRILLTSTGVLKTISTAIRLGKISKSEGG